MMKTKVVKKYGFVTVAFCLVILAAFAGTASAQNGLTKIADGIYSYVDSKDPSPGNSFGANAGIIVGRNGVVVVDTLISAMQAKRFIKDIRAVTDRPIIYVINTHDHLDHMLGNSEFVKLGAAVISHERCKKSIIDNAATVLQKAKNYGLSDDEMSGTVVAPPTLTFSDRMEIDLGDRTVALVYAGPSHTDGSILVSVPGSKVLFAGDILFTNYHPNMRDGDLTGWVKALDQILTMDSAGIIIPGHGPVSTKQDVQDMKHYLVTFDKKARELAAQSNDPEYIASEIKKALPHREYFGQFVPLYIKGKYLKDAGK